MSNKSAAQEFRGAQLGNACKLCLEIEKAEAKGKGKAKGIKVPKHPKCGWCGMLFGTPHLAIEGPSLAGIRTCTGCARDAVKIGERVFIIREGQHE